MTTIGFFGHGQSLNMSSHCQKRLRERGLSCLDISYILQNGEMERCGNSRMLFSIPDSPFTAIDPDPRRAKLAGSVVIQSEDGTIITAYLRNAVYFRDLGGKKR